MPRINPVDPANAPEKVKGLLDAVQQKLGAKPNMMRAMGQSPALLEGYLSLMGALGTGKLGGKLGSRLALAIAETNQCEYCVSAHAVLGKRAGLTDQDISEALQPGSSTGRDDVAVKFTLAIVKSHGAVSDAELRDVRAAGFDDADIAEMVGHVALNVLTNYFNRLAHTEIDFPRVDPKLRAQR
jgi:uncharacterized peroxidase-related enzyme